MAEAPLISLTSFPSLGQIEFDRGEHRKPEKSESGLVTGDQHSISQGDHGTVNYFLSDSVASEEKSNLGLLKDSFKEHWKEILGGEGIGIGAGLIGLFGEIPILFWGGVVVALLGVLDYLIRTYNKYLEQKFVLKSDLQKPLGAENSVISMTRYNEVAFVGPVSVGKSSGYKFLLGERREYSVHSQQVYEKPLANRRMHLVDIPGDLPSIGEHGEGLLRLQKAGRDTHGDEVPWAIVFVVDGFRGRLKEEQWYCCDQHDPPSPIATTRIECENRKCAHAYIGSECDRCNKMAPELQIHCEPCKTYYTIDDLEPLDLYQLQKYREQEMVDYVETIVAELRKMSMDSKWNEPSVAALILNKDDLPLDCSGMLDRIHSFLHQHFSWDVLYDPKLCHLQLLGGHGVNEFCAELRRRLDEAR